MNPIEYNGTWIYYANPMSKDLVKNYNKFVTAGKEFDYVKIALLEKMADDGTDYFVVPAKNNSSGYNLKFKFDRINYGSFNSSFPMDNICYKFDKIIFEP